MVRRALNDALDIGEEFYVWEMATAVAERVPSASIPSISRMCKKAKTTTKRFLEEYKQKGALPEQARGAEGRGLTVYCDADTLKQFGSGLALEAFITAHLSRVKPGDYVALLDYIQETPEHEELIQAIRSHLRDAACSDDDRLRPPLPAFDRAIAQGRSRQRRVHSGHG